MSLNFNVDPYYDDFDPSKNYHRILFKPGYAVQARELTQSQTILQNQISNFADNIFTQNTPVTGGKITVNLNSYFIKLNYQYGGVNIEAASFLNKTIQNQYGTVVAKVIAATEGTIGGDYPTLIVTYISGLHFTDNDIVTDSLSNLTATVTTSTTNEASTGFSSTASISTGVFYVVNGYSKSSTQNDDGSYTTYSIGNFVQVNPQTIILNKYNNTPSYRVGLEITETIADYADDSSLLDPASGASNYQAPGADRYLVSLTLITLPLTVGNDQNFIELLSIKNGQIVKQTDGTVYSVINDYFAKRDYETNGDYVVQDFKITPTKFQNRDNPNKYILNIGKGIAYVHGYRIENQSQIQLETDRARTTQSVDNNTGFVDYGSYFVVDTLGGDFNVTQMPSVDLHCVPSSGINSANVNTYNSTLVGTGFIRALDYQTSSGSNTKTYIFNAHISDISTTTLTGNVASATATTITINDSSAKFSYLTANAYINSVLSITSGTNSGDRRTIVSSNNLLKTITVSPAFTVTPDATSKFFILFDTGSVNSIVQKNGSYTLTANANINVAEGKFPAISTGVTTYNSVSAPEMIFKYGNQYVADVSGTTYYTTQIHRNQGFSSISNKLEINVSSPIKFQGTVGATYSGEAFKQLFTLINTATGQILDFTSSGTGSVYIDSETKATFTSATYSSITTGIDVIASVFVSNGDSSTNIRKTKTYITGSTSTAASFSSISGVSNTTIALDGTNPAGQTYILNSAINTDAISLYVNDVSKITKIIDTGSTGTTPSGSLSNYKDITTSFSFDNGQRDNFYDHASIKLLPGVTPPQGNILVVYDYFLHGGGDGYFNVNSYDAGLYADIPTYTAKNGTIYNLRDCIDFRLCRANKQKDYVWEYRSGASATTIGSLIPQNISNIQNSYSYYLGRKDKLVLTKDSKFLVVEGTPAITPQYPIEPDGSLVLAEIALDPYTANIPGEESSFSYANASNLAINKILHKRWAKSDISNLQKQVDNLEYYTSLNILEQNANSLQIPDVNGLNRFKNGILVDDFSSFGVAETKDPTYSANINIRKKQLSPVTDVVNFQLQSPQVLSSLGTLTGISGASISSLAGTNTNLFTLPYTSANIVTQQLASSTISVNPFNVVNYQGTATLNPPMDNWYNTIMPPAIAISDPNMQFDQTYGGINAINGGDFASLSGTSSVLTATQRQTEKNYVSQLAGLNNAELSTATSTALATNGGNITNNAVIPYIRPQEVIVRSKNMLINTPVSCWFDGVNVSKWMVAPNTIEVTALSGTFQEDDIVGFYVANVSTFYPIARVVSVYNYPDGTSCRLYIATLSNIPQTVTTTTLQNAFFDSNGIYQGKTASGTVNFSSLTSIHTSGSVTGIGGGWTSALETNPRYIFKSQYIEGFSTFGNQYAVWGDQSNGASYTISYPVPLPAADTYSITAWGTGTGTVTLDTTTLNLPGYGVNNSTVSGTYTTSGGTKTLSWNVTNGGVNIPGIGVVIKDSSGKAVWNSLTPNDLTYTSAGTEIQMPAGGSFYVGATKIQLDSAASSSNTYYVGATVSVKSTYVYEYNYGAIYVPPFYGFYGDGDGGRYGAWLNARAQYNAVMEEQAAAALQSIIYLAETYTYESNITSYNGVTKTITLDAPVNVSLGYNSQYGNMTSQYSIKGTAGSVASAIISGTVPSLSTDERGQFVGIFNIPGSDFFAGERVFRIDNRTVDTDPDTATTFSEATFHATGLITNNQTNNFSPSVDSSSIAILPTSQKSYNIISTQAPFDPIAQSFIISRDNYPNGVFLNSIKVFFASKSTTTDITLSVVGTLNGYPNGKTLDYSTVTLHNSEVKTSSSPHYLDPNSYTEFKFSAPVYIQPGALYAFVLHSSSSDYKVYYAQQNQIAVPSTAIDKPVSQGGVLPSDPTKIGAAPYVGALFESQNGQTWTADQTKDLMFVINQCVFDTTQTAVLNFVVPKGLPYRKLGKNDILHRIDANSVPNLIGVATSPTRPMDAFNVTTTDFVPSLTNINYAYSTTLMDGLVPTDAVSVTPGKYGMPLQDNIYLNDGRGERVLLNYSNNSFQLTATLSSSDENVSPIISDDGLTLFNILYYVNNMGIDGNIISVANSGSGYGPNTVINITPPDIGSDYPVFEYTTNTSTGGISSITVTHPGSGYLKTPTITVSDANTHISSNSAVITVAGETSPTGGNAYARYITKKVVMTPGNDSGDLRVYYTAYKPVGSDVYVYYKILNSADTSTIESQNWQLMTQTGNPNVYSTDRNNLIEFECAPGTNGAADNYISYTSTNGQTYNTFIQFVIKVVIATNDPTSVPFLKDIRALALPSGTGL